MDPGAILTMHEVENVLGQILDKTESPCLGEKGLLLVIGKLGMTLVSPLIFFEEVILLFLNVQNPHILLHKSRGPQEWPFDNLIPQRTLQCLFWPCGMPWT